MALVLVFQYGVNDNESSYNTARVYKFLLRPTPCRKDLTTMNLTTDEATRPVRSTDMALRLQRLVAGWRGAERGQPLTALHDECRNAVEHAPPSRSPRA